MHPPLPLSWASILFALLLVLTPLAHGDIYMKQKRHVDGMGQMFPARDEIIETWITRSRMSVNTDHRTTIVDLDAQTVTHIDHDEQAVMAMPFDFTKLAVERADGVSADQGAQMRAFMDEMMDLQVRVAPTDEQRTINGWDCRKYEQRLDMGMGMGTVRSEIWATTDIDIDRDLYAKYRSAMMAQMPGVGGNLAAIAEELEKIEGIHVSTKQSNEMMGRHVTSSTELIEYREGEAPAKAFVIPDGYRREDML